jgi:hypothetical protein
MVFLALEQVWPNDWGEFFHGSLTMLLRSRTTPLAYVTKYQQNVTTEPTTGNVALLGWFAQL